MKRLLTSIVIFGLSVLSLAAQQNKRIYLFPEFTVGQMEFYNHTIVDVKMNFDAAGQKVYYYDGGTLMEMTNLPMVKILQVGDRVFVVREGLLCEVFDKAIGPVLVNWKFKSVNKGSVGAMGIPTQGKVDVISSMDLGRSSYSPSNRGEADRADIHNVEIWEQKNDNTYFISIHKQWYRIKTLKDLYAAFPDYAPQLKGYAKSEHLTMVKADDAFKMFDYLHTLVD